MKIHQTLKSWHRLSALVGGFALFTGASQAAPFLYTQGDLVLAFRQTGNTYDYVVNIGKATNYNNVAAGKTIVITNFSATQFGTAFAGGLDGVSWSVAGANRYPALNTNLAENTLWASRARENVGSQSAPWVRFGFYSQASSGSQFDIVGVNARDYSSSVASNANNTATGVIIPTTSDYAFTTVVTAGGNFDGNFQGSIVNATAADFTSDSANLSRSDLYELLPGSGYPDGRYLGYFELKPDGSLTFNTLAPAPTRPTITSITRSGGISTVSFTTTSSFTHRLRYTTAAGLATPVATWSIGSSVTGTGSVLSLQNTDAAAITFYTIEVLP